MQTQTQAQTGDKVRVHYTGTLADGSQFDSSREGEPIDFTIGGGRLIPGFEQAVAGMKAGETRTVTIPHQEAYGAHRPEMVDEVQRAELPPDLELEVGTRLHAYGGNQEPLLLTVVALSDDTVTLDANHPLAGEDLTFEIELVEIL